MIFLEKGGNLHPIIRGKSLVNRKIFPEGYCVIPNKAQYMDDETWDKLVKVVSPGIRKMKVVHVDFVLSFLLSIYLTLNICPSKFSAD